MRKVIEIPPQALFILIQRRIRVYRKAMGLELITDLTVPILIPPLFLEFVKMMTVKMGQR